MLKTFSRPPSWSGVWSIFWNGWYYLQFALFYFTWNCLFCRCLVKGRLCIFIWRSCCILCMPENNKFWLDLTWQVEPLDRTEKPQLNSECTLQTDNATKNIAWWGLSEYAVGNPRPAATFAHSDRGIHCLVCFRGMDRGGNCQNCFASVLNMGFF